MLVDPLADSALTAFMYALSSCFTEVGHSCRNLSGYIWSKRCQGRSDDPANAFSDGPNQVPLDQAEALLATLQRFDQMAKANPL